MSKDMSEIPILINVTEDVFRNDIYPKRKPVVLRGLDIGSCQMKWTDKYLEDMGGNREVKIHVTQTPQMDFINKNFIYRSLKFDELIRRAPKEKQQEFFISESEKYYLRALGEDPRRDIADVRKQFPDLTDDIRFPKLYDEDRFFSSVFRIASPGLQLWTHYDVMDNMLIQVRGRKRVVMFHPNSAECLYLNGDKSEVLNIDNPDLTRFPKFPEAERLEVTLQAGDVLFIPALWFHNVIAEEFGIAVNVFWKHLDDSMYDSKDTYGNKDLQPAARAFQIVDRAVKALEELPDEYKEFYALRVISRIRSKTLKTNFPT